MTRLKNWHWWRNNPIDLQQRRQHLRDTLAQNGREAPGNTSLILLEHVLNQSKSWILSHGDYQLSPLENRNLQKIIDALLKGVPLPYILGRWDFYGRSFQVTPDVLIPRPETELLVEKAIQHTQSVRKPRIIDIGTGSGAIAISLAAELPDATVLGVDLSSAALRVARINAQCLGQSRIHFIQGDLLTAFRGPYDLICANLPYIPRQNLVGLDVAKWEPRLALDGGETGLEVIRELLRQAQSRLSRPGVILLETEASLGPETQAAAQAAFPDAHNLLIQDLSGRDRLVEIHLSRQ